MGILLFFILLTIFGNSKCQIIVGRNEGLSRRHAIINCIMKILDSVYINSVETGTIATLLDEYREKYTEELLLSTIFSEFKWNVLNFKRVNDSNKYPTNSFIDMYIIRIKEISEIEKNFVYLSSQFWNPKAKVIVFAERLTETKEHINRQIFQTLWKHKAIDSIVLLPLNNSENIFEAYTWFPYHFGNCGKYDNATLIDTCSDGNYRLNENFFPNKIPQIFNGCTIRIRTIIWPPYVNPPNNFTMDSRRGINFTSGLEIILLNMIANHLNLTLLYSVSSKNEDWGGILDNGTALGLFKTLLEEKVDLGVGSLAATSNRLTYLEPSETYGFESITWVVPSASKKPEWLNLINVYKSSTYSMIFITFLIIFFVTYCVSWVIEETTSYRVFGNNFMNLLAVFLGLSLKFKPIFSSSRLAFFTCAFLNLIIGAVYQTTLISFLAEPRYEKEISKVEEIFDKNLEILYLPQVKMYYNFDTEDWRMRKISNESFPCPNANECISNIAHFRNSSMATPRLFLLYSLDRLITKDGRLLVYWFKEDMISFPIHIYMTKGYPLARSININIVQIMQTGIMDKIQDDLKEKLNIKSHNIKEEDTTKLFILELGHLKFAFIILLAGLGVSAIVFVLELIFYNKCYKQIEFMN